MALEWEGEAPAEPSSRRKTNGRLSRSFALPHHSQTGMEPARDCPLHPRWQAGRADTTTRRPAMRIRSDGMIRLARFLTIVAVALLGGALWLNSASAQQEQSGRSDKSSARDNSG